MRGLKLWVGLFIALAVVLAACRQPAPPADTVDPEIAITAPEAGAEFTVGDAITVTGTASDDRGVDSVTVQFAGAQDSVAADYDEADGTWTAELTAPAAGDHTITATAADEAGNEATASVSVTSVAPADEEDPVIAITSPEEDAEFTEGETITVTGTASDDRGVDSVTVQFEGAQDSATADYDEADGTWTAELTAPAAGDHTITATAADEAGNEATASVNITVVPADDPDTVDPEVSITAPSAGDLFEPNETITVTGTATDDRGIDRVEVGLEGETAVEAAYDADAETWTIDLTAPDEDGSYTITATAFDEAGNSSADTLSITVPVDEEEPTITITAPADDDDFVHASPITVTGTASDNRGVTSVSVELDGDTVDADISGNTWSATVMAPEPNDNSYTITATATDAAGNEASDSVNISTYYPEPDVISGQLRRVPPLESVVNPPPAPPENGDGFLTGGLAAEFESVRGRGDFLPERGVNFPELNRIIVTMNAQDGFVMPASAGGTQLDQWHNRVESLAAEYAADGVVSAHGLLPTIGVAIFGVAAGTDVEATVAALNSDRRVVAAERDSWLFGDARPAPTTNLFDHQWAHELTDAQIAWETSTEALGVRVAVLDSGLAAPIGTTDLADAHPGITGNLIAGFDFVSAIDLTPGPDDDPDPVFDALVERYPALRFLDGDGEAGWDANPYEEISTGFDGQNGVFTGLSPFGGHGTHVAGIVGGKPYDGRVTGVAWEVGIQPIRVLGHFGGGTGADVLAGVAYAAGFPVTDPLDSTVTHTNPTPAHIINMSLGGGAYSVAAEMLYLQVQEAGVLVVASAGNSAVATPHYPSGYNGVMSVSSTDYIHWVEELGGPAVAFSDLFSNFGSTIDIAAPGGLAWLTPLDLDNWNTATGLTPAPYVISTGWEWYDSPDPETATRVDEEVHYYSAGTSMSAPYVSGAAALLLSIDPSLTAADLRAILTGTARRVDDSFLFFNVGEPEADWDPFFGYGALDLNAAVAAAETGVIQRLEYTTFVEATHTDGTTIFVEANPDLSFEITGLAEGDWTVHAGVTTGGVDDIGASGEYYGEYEETITVEAGQPLYDDVSFDMERHWLESSP